MNFKLYVKEITRVMEHLMIGIEKEGGERTVSVALVNADDFDRLKADQDILQESIVLPDSKESFMKMIEYISNDEEMRDFGFYKVDDEGWYAIPNSYLELIPDGMKVYCHGIHEQLVFNRDDYQTKFTFDPLPFGIKIKNNV